VATDDIELFFDLGSPYAYLAVARAEQVLGKQPVLRPVLLGAIFQARGFGSWAQTAQREQRIAELEGRAARYGLPPFVWPSDWPMNGLAAMRACVWAQEHGGLDAFVAAAYHDEFARGEDIAGPSALTAIAHRVGLPGDELERAIDSDPIKLRLRQLTEAAWGRGVRGIPTIAVGPTLLYGDDQLEQVPLLTAS
jgi:2-hydroxychromene-2-carboxylate isomerase